MKITLEKADFQKEYNSYLKEILKDIQMPGFRRGKVPQSVLERKGGQSFKEDVMNQIAGNTVKTIFEDESFPPEFTPLPFRDPEIDGKLVFDLEKDFVFSVTYDIAPQFGELSIDGFEVEVESAEASDADVQRELNKIRERNAIVIDRDEGEKARKGDVVTVNYGEVDEAGAVKAGTEREGFVFEVGLGRTLYQFDDDVIGLKVGEERVIKRKKDAADGGGPIQLRIKATKIQKRDLPDLDDEFAQDVSEKYKTLADLKKALKEQLNAQIERRLEEKVREELLEKIAGDKEIEIPASLILAETQNRVRDLLQRGVQPGSKDFQVIYASVDAMLRRFYLISELVKQNKIEATDGEIEAEIRAAAKSVGDDEESFLAYVKEHKAAEDEVKAKIVESKLFALLKEKNTIKKGKKATYLDLFPEDE